MANTDDAARLLDYYLSDAVKPEYAVMLSAPWGAGKTHFVKQYLDARSIALPQKQRPCYLYASLYGVTSVSGINDQFLAQIHPRLGSKYFRVFGGAVAGVMEKFAGLKGAGQVAQDVLLKLDDKVLVIDDLERCAMKIPDVMGFLNSLVEHENLKVIILANEQEIPDKDVYEKQKEKLVGKTITVQADPSEVLEKLRSELKTEIVREVVERDKAALLATFNACEKPNFRSLRAILEDFERLIECVDPRLREKPEALKQLLLYMVATGCEARRGSLQRGVLKHLRTSLFPSNLFSKQEKAPADKLFDQLKSQYLDVKWTDPIVGPEHLSALFFEGRINVAKINEGLARHPEVVGQKALPAWRVLWEWGKLSNTEYQKARADLLNELKDRTITQPTLVLHVAGIVLSLLKYNDPILGADVLPDQYFSEYVAKLLEDGVFGAENGAFTFGGMAGAGLAYQSYDTKEFQVIHAMVKKASEEAERRRLQTLAGEYVARLAESTDSYSSLYEHGVQDGNYAATPLLHHIAVEDFAQLLIVDSRSNDQLFASLIKRYEHDYAGRQALVKEYNWTDELKTHLLLMADAQPAPFAQMLRDRVDYVFEAIGEGIGRPGPQS